MRYPFATIAVLTVIALLGAAQSPAWKNTGLKQGCEPNYADAEIAEPADICALSGDVVTWGDWFSGESRSTQFHFLDFFELMFGDDNKRDYGSGEHAGPKLGY